METADVETFSDIRDMYVRQRGHRVLGQGWTEGEAKDDEHYPPHYYFSHIVARTMIHTIGEANFVTVFDASSMCSNCGAYPSFDYVDENTITMKTDCEYAGGIRTVVEIEVPSGLLVCDDSLHDAFGIDLNDDDASYNSRLGQHQHILRQAAAGVAYGPVLNTSPTLYEIEPGKYVVANPGFDWDTDEETPLSFDAKPVAGFCTDLWAYSMADYQLFLARGGTPVDEDDKYGTRSVIEVPPGRYRLTHHTGETGFDHDAHGEVIFAHFERINR